MMCRPILLAGAPLLPGHEASACTLTVEPLPPSSSGRIAAVSVTVSDAAIIPGRLSAGWRLNVDNDPSWQTSLKGIAVVGAAFVDSREIKDLISLEPEPGYTCRFLDRHGRLTLRLSIYNNDAMRNFTLRWPAVRVGD